MIASLLADVGNRVPLSWLTRIVLPGVILAVTVTCVHGLGWAHALDYAVARTNLNALLAAGNGHSGASTLLIATIIAAGTAAGFLADVASHAVSAALFRFGRPGWHIRTVTAEISVAYRGVDLALIWPRIWLLCSDATRREIQTAWDQYGTATLQGSWGAIYLLLGLWWPPSLIVGLTLLATAYWKASRASRAFAELTRATVDITITQLASTIGMAIPPGRTIGEREAAVLNESLRRITPQAESKRPRSGPSTAR